jgi:hypothetical protein
MSPGFWGGGEGFPWPSAGPSIGVSHNSLIRPLFTTVASPSAQN